jgi:hypothetical protein
MAVVDDLIDLVNTLASLQAHTEAYLLRRGSMMSSRFERWFCLAVVGEYDVDSIQQM